MSKNRLEAFSDGVFAIVITLLVLDVRVPDVPIAQLWPALVSLSPRLLAHTLTFLIIGLYWVLHHHGMHRLARTDGVFVWLNIVFLLFVSFLPFPTSMLGRYPGEQLPVLLYCANLLAANGSAFVMLWWANRKPELMVPEVRATFFRAQWPIYVTVNGVYLVVIAVSFLSPRLSTGLLSLALLGVMVLSARERV